MNGKTKKLTEALGFLNDCLTGVKRELEYVDPIEDVTGMLSVTVPPAALQSFEVVDGRITDVGISEEDLGMTIDRENEGDFILGAGAMAEALEYLNSASHAVGEMSDTLESDDQEDLIKLTPEERDNIELIRHIKQEGHRPVIVTYHWYQMLMADKVYAAKVRNLFIELAKLTEDTEVADESKKPE